MKANPAGSVICSEMTVDGVAHLLLEFPQVLALRDNTPMVLGIIPGSDQLPGLLTAVDLKRYLVHWYQATASPPPSQTRRCMLLTGLFSLLLSPIRRFERFHLVERTRPILTQQARERPVSQQFAAGLAARAIIGFV